MSGSKKHGETKEIVCPVCGKTFEKLLSFLRVHPQIHCSRKCMGISNASPERFVRTVCNACGKEFKKRRDHLTENNYCSRACAGKAKQVDGAKWKDPDQIKNYMKDYLSKNREQHNANSRKWRIENKAKRTHAQINRRSADKKGDFTLSQWEEMKNTYDHTCLNCGRKEPEIKLQPDHIVPVVFGGITTTDNIQPLCARCNKSKGANIIDYRARYPEIKFVEVMK
jgi:5-methylcytosine-specific restriction endonuclease McrA